MNSVQKAFLISKYLHQNNGSATLNEISNFCEIPKSTAHRLLDDLIQINYVQQNEKTQCYELGVAALDDILFCSWDSTIWQGIQPYIQGLCRDINENISVGVLNQPFDFKYRLVLSAPCTHSLSVSEAVGTTHYCYNTAVGKCLLAFSNIEDNTIFNAFIQNQSGSTIVEWERFSSELNKVLENGYAYDNEEFEKGLFGIAVPIFRDKHLVAALSVAIPEERFSNFDFYQLIDKLKSVSDSITKHYSAPLPQNG